MVLATPRLIQQLLLKAPIIISLVQLVLNPPYDSLTTIISNEGRLDTFRSDLTPCVCKFRLDSKPNLNHDSLLSFQDHSAALALVTVHRSDESSGEDTQTCSATQMQDDPDMQRAKDLVELHYGVKMNHVHGQDAALKQARAEVESVLGRLDGRKMEDSVQRGLAEKR